MRLGEEEHIVLVTMHHIVSDGWSIGILIREVSALYEAFRKGETSPLDEPPVQYADYAVWQRGWLEGEVLQAQVDYWTSRLAGLSPLELPTDRPRSAGAGPGRLVCVRRFCLEPSSTKSGLSQNNGATLYMTLLAVFQVLLYRYSGQESFGVGSPIAGRTRSELEGLIGFFVNTLVMRADLSGNPSFQGLLSRVRQSAIDAYTHQDLPFEKTRRRPAPQKRRGQPDASLPGDVRDPRNAPLPPLRSPELELTPLEPANVIAKFDLTLFAMETPEGLGLTMEYNTHLFEAATIDRMLGHFQTLLEGAIANPSEPINALPMMSPVEQRMLGDGMPLPPVRRPRSWTDWPRRISTPCSAILMAALILGNAASRAPLALAKLIRKSFILAEFDAISVPVFAADRCCIDDRRSRQRRHRRWR